MFIYTGLDYYIESDNGLESKYFEKINVVAGKDFIQNKNEVIVSTEYVNLLGKTPQEIIGQKVIIEFEDKSDAYTIVGVFDAFLKEKRNNSKVFKSIKSNDYNYNVDSFLISAIFANDAVPNDSIVGSDYYYFFSNDDEYNEIVNAIENINEESEFSDRFIFYTPNSIKLDNDVEWGSIMQIKMYLLLIVSVLTGLSILGTMLNSVYDRKKEIGIKKALGASDIDIMIEFIIENLINAFVAIFIAVFIASIGFLLYDYYQRQILFIDYSIRFYPSTILLFVCFTLSTVIGFSLIPAYQATQLNVVDTLRDE